MPPLRIVPPLPTVELRRDEGMSDEQARAALRTCYSIILAAAQRADEATGRQEGDRGTA